ncbi:MBL fold metallo-hydrolase [Thermobifida halotolerans]|uniref:MBL fold metallo-hydrolase n=1 Tax=Thermobifida halotolerans TaxID=483545 RepID=A0A399G1W7_9ACTN|nr:MBL fold metallo-hydrolase [Thermobifida halotolerans]UOE19588.1 MBL fold metallo-hydrolase [Thermobifida halotolerans]
MFWKRKAKKKDDAEADAASTTAKDTEETEDAEAGSDADADAAAEERSGDVEETDAAAESDEDADGKEAETDVEGGGSELPVERVEIPGTLEVDGEEYEVVTNTWIVQVDEDGVVVVNPGQDAKAVLDAVGDREIYLVACTNGYQPHIAGAVEVAERDEAPIAVHPRELRRWRKVHGVEHNPEIEAEGGGRLTIGDVELEILATPGTAPGSLSYYFPHLKVVCSGDTLLAGQLGTVGEGYLDYTTQLASVGEVLLSLPEETRVLPSTGEETTIGAESKNFDSWVAGE